MYNMVMWVCLVAVIACFGVIGVLARNAVQIEVSYEDETVDAEYEDVIYM